MAWITFNPPLRGDAAKLFAYLLSCMKTAEFVTEELLERFIRKTNWPPQLMEDTIEELKFCGAIQHFEKGIKPITHVNIANHASFASGANNVN